MTDEERVHKFDALAEREEAALLERFHHLGYVEFMLSGDDLTVIINTSLLLEELEAITEAMRRIQKEMHDGRTGRNVR